MNGDLMRLGFDPFENFRPFGYYVLLRMLEDDESNDDWVKKGNFFLAKGSSIFDYSFFARVVRKGEICKEDDIQVGDIIRLPNVYTRERFWDSKGKMFIITKEHNCIGKLIEEEDTGKKVKKDKKYYATSTISSKSIKVNNKYKGDR